jgi:hemoglobin-like flavoprotein
MTSRQLTLLRESFERLRPMPRAFGVRFYEHLFRLDPSLRSLFKRDPENQPAMFATALVLSVSGLVDDGFAPASVRELGARHDDYEIPGTAWRTFGEALLATLQDTLGAEFTPEVREAWAAAYDMLASAMKRSRDDARAAKAEPAS